MSRPDDHDQRAADAATVALLRRLERAGVDRTVLADMPDRDQAAVFAAEARNRNRR